MLLNEQKLKIKIIDKSVVKDLRKHAKEQKRKYIHCVLFLFDCNWNFRIVKIEVAKKSYIKAFDLINCAVSFSRSLNIYFKYDINVGIKVMYEINFSLHI